MLACPENCLSIWAMRRPVSSAVTGGFGPPGILSVMGIFQQLPFLGPLTALQRLDHIRRVDV